MVRKILADVFFLNTEAYLNTFSKGTARDILSSDNLIAK